MALFHKPFKPELQSTYKNALPIFSPLSGKVMSLDSVPNKLFSQRLFGEGVAIEPSGYQLLAPFSGSMLHFPETAGLLRIKATNGLSLQIQMGLDPQQMMGEGFKRKLKVGDSFEQGQILLEFDLRKMKMQLNCTLCPITVLNSDKVQAVQGHFYQVRAGEDKAMTVYL